MKYAVTVTLGIPPMAVALIGIKMGVSAAEQSMGYKFHPETCGTFKRRWCARLYRFYLDHWADQRFPRKYEIKEIDENAPTK